MSEPSHLPYQPARPRGAVVKDDAPGIGRETAKEAAMPLIERRGTQEDLERLPALVIGFPIRPPAASANVSEAADVEDTQGSDEAAEGRRDG